MKVFVPQSVQTQAIQTGISGIAASNTTYSSGTVTITGVGGGVTVSSNTGQRIDISVAAPVAQTTQIVQSAIAASDTTYTSGLVTITGVGGGITVSSNTGQRIDLSVAAQSVQVVQSAIAASNTTYTSGAVLLTGSNMVTVKSSGAGQTVIIDATQSVQVVQSAIAASNTTYTSGLVTITGVGGGITVSSNTGQRIDLSVAAPINFSAGASNLGNTAGNTGVTGTRLVLVGTNMVSLSQTTGAAGGTISFDATQSVQTQSVMRAGVSNLGNTAGSTGVTGTRLVLAGSNNITLSQSTDANGGTVSFIGGAGAGDFSAGASNLGNTAGATGVSGTRLVLVGSNNITLSQTTGAAGATVSIIGGAGGGGVAIEASNTTYTSGTVVFSARDSFRSALSVASVGAQSVIVSDAGPSAAYWVRGPMGTVSPLNIVTQTNSMFVFPLIKDGANRFDANMTIEQLRVFLSYNATATSISQIFSSSLDVYLYSRDSLTMTRINSASMTYGNTAANNANSASWNGVRDIALTGTAAWSSLPHLKYGGEYYLGLRFRSNVTSYSSHSWVNVGNPATAVYSGRVYGALGGVDLRRPGYGLVANPGTASFNWTILNESGGSNSANHDPYIILHQDTGITY